MSLFNRIVTAPVRAGTWRETGYVLLGAGTATVCVAVVAATVYAALASVTVVGLAVLAVVLRAARVVGVVERARVRALPRASRPAGPTLAPPVRTNPGPLGWVRDALGDRGGWRCVLYAITAAPVGAAQAYVVALWWALALVTATFPLWSVLLPVVDGHRMDQIRIGSWHWYPDAWPYPVLVSVIGLAGVFAAAWIVRACVGLDRLRLRLLAMPAPAEGPQAMRRRRDHAVEQAGAHLRRIERDLHDGAQAHMVTLAMELGQARDELESGTDPQRIARRVTAAHEGAKQALAELRDLARGIYPAVLTDVGLEGAVPLLTTRCPVPVSIDVHIDERPTAAIEAAAYFCISELLTNMTKHSAATAGSIRVRRVDAALRIQVRDDGTGGAKARAGGGLAGLSDRVDSLDGTLDVSSPPGGPTLVTVELPCES
jgi:signal transduction histidine kinase